MTKSERTVLVLQGGSALGADEHQKTFTWGANVLTRNKPALWGSIESNEHSQMGYTSSPSPDALSRVGLS
jgi:hypothetical protein